VRVVEYWRVSEVKSAPPNSHWNVDCSVRDEKTSARIKAQVCKARARILFAAYDTRAMYPSRHSPSVQSLVQVEHTALLAVDKAGYI